MMYRINQNIVNSNKLYAENKENDLDGEMQDALPGQQGEGGRRGEGTYFKSTTNR